MRQAVADAASSAGADTIVVTPGLGTINLASVISYVANGDLAIQGNGVTVNGNGSDGVLHETGGTGALLIDGTTVTGANATSGTVLGAVVKHADIAPIVLIGKGSLTVTGCIIRCSA